MSQDHRRNNKMEMSIYEQLQAIKEEMCEHYCHYRKTYVYQSDVDEKCEHCPLTRL